MSTADSEELEALFDSIIHAQNTQGTEAQAPVTATAAVGVATEASSVSIAFATARAGMDMSDQAKSMFSHIGQLTRNLHDTMRELGLDKSIEKAASSIPDARDRLGYVATMTEQAAERTLNAIDAAKPLQDSIGNGASKLSTEWSQLFDGQLTIDEFRALVENTRAHLHATTANSSEISSQMLEIMMAQDFQDLTGQVIKKVLGMVKDMEQQLCDFLLTFSPQEVKLQHESQGELNGPVVSAAGRSDVVTNQAQVDDLLESLGF